MQSRATTFVSLLLVLTTIAAMPGCKKGEDDPFLSFRSRKNRVVGTWEVEKLNHVESQADPSFQFSETTVVASDVISIDREFSNGPVDDAKGSIDVRSYEFSDDGTFKQVLQYNYVRTALVNAIPTEITVQIYQQRKGTWDFLGKNPDFKNRERLQLNTTYRYDFRNDVWGPNGEFNEIQSETKQDILESEIWELTRLSHQEIKAEGAAILTERSNLLNGDEPVETTRKVEFQITLVQ